jgi:predicted enzyme related to lactoylglutathione lyase
MNDPFVPGVGRILSADIAVPEHERELRFYSRVLGTGESPRWREDLMNELGMPIIGLGAQSPEYADLPLQWMPHIQVADVGGSVERALALGGTEIMHGKDDAGASLWAALFDPNGAAFGIMPVVPAEAVQQPEGDAAPDTIARCGRIAWLDLTVPDAATTRDFYREVIGWSAQDVAMEDAGEGYADYSMHAPDGSSAAGVCHARGTNQGLPSVWLLYLPVGDLAESLRRVREEGGEVVKERKGSDGALAYAVVRDPVGVCLALVPG